jgi:hypothetical protein
MVAASVTANEIKNVDIRGSYVSEMGNRFEMYITAYIISQRCVKGKKWF